MINSASHAFCNQPALGGPVYWIRNIAYHLPGGSTRLTSGSAGVLSTTTRSCRRPRRRVVEHALAEQSVPRRELGAGDLQRQHLHQLHLVGLQRLPAEPRRGRSFQWNSPPASVRADYNDPQRRAALETRGFASLAEYSRATGQDQHSVLVDYDVFMNVPPLDAQDVKSVQKVYKAEDFDFRLKPDSAAVDRGLALPNVNEDFSGKAPDLGALETGRPVPHYGPR